MDLIDRLLEGIKSAVDKHWDYQKSILEVKPEYLFTVATADELVKGFDGISGLDIEVHLEKPVNPIGGQGLIRKVGLKEYFGILKEKVSRSGKVDIFVDIEPKDHSLVIELKGFDPNATEVKKEIERFIDFLQLYNGNTAIEGCYLSFPTKDNKRTWIDKQVSAVGLPSSLTHDIRIKGYHTNEGPEDGLPYFYANVLKVCRF
ncbi:hypothetical protein HOP62_05375 [Halomonas sp. MCCC 1A17488]|uniref:hypothetical protein n=1 Tax=unclassified Halomonas TaxID=2609666 RepID=UPI0018D20758|nr:MULTISPECIES: hypothetical protein [unclassified Halomonas]MCE8015507.1 hypothetical protein [Halomonas sp. MCCC 1A17488]MCG3238840.1 hypothetical protein [Halomonas sp. MCCC 1A17488]QPP51198.1 hypothetical protein I4484_09025 [Halomonas sp. SS10-MC5]